MAGPTEPGSVDLRVNRWVPFDDMIGIEGADLSDATMLMQVRAYRDAPGDPLISLVNAAPPAQGLSVSAETVEGMPTSTIRIMINETTIEGLLPFPANGVEPGADVVLVWDLLLSKTGFTKARWFEGAFIIVPGATQA
ncbi:hypothetical protein U1769_24115 [Sphingomonas sp. ZT3P38]|uniref:hypothetical protein n=1 Tax=Parasphingomonas zepuensis TaxID=3096161 RepID=UPI002FC94C60